MRRKSLSQILRPITLHHDVVELLLRSEPYTRNFCASRTSKARGVVKANAAKTALHRIVQANKVFQHLRDQASTILHELPS